ncbi:hypothetical protein AK88_05209 [Plasmodium fragile]|uniref:Schizont-infected cell agglutination C-terminal domain-containing protein n=1 Tax=Plasmodium fragile TaxID=5857 RepID=A0A0D9QHJ0_PLAFR|nr:uncharacterized protein AK88_05209 [Plasmodium fragile]KJP85166.1 hypothetical protein AK88_05209 [Plasmodium fragile]
MSSDKDYSEQLWTDIHDLFQVLAGSINRKDDFNTSVCKAAYPTWTLTRHMAQFVVCRRIVNIFLFMDKIDNAGGTWRRQGIFAGDEQLERYVRCMLGNIAMAELFKNNCKAGDIIAEVSTQMPVWRGLGGYADGSKICTDINYGSLMLGSKFVAATMAGWIRDWSIKNGAGKLAARGKRTCNNDSTDAQKASMVPAVRMFQEEDNPVITELVKEGKDLEMEKKKQLAEELGAKREQDGVVADIMRKITAAEAKLGVRSELGKHRTGTVQTPSPSPPGPSHHGSGESSGANPAPTASSATPVEPGDKGKPPGAPTATEAAPNTEGSGHDKTKDTGQDTKPGGSQTTKPSTTPLPTGAGTGNKGDPSSQGARNTDVGRTDPSGAEDPVGKPPGSAAPGSQPQAPASPVLPARPQPPPPQPAPEHKNTEAGPVPQPPPPAPPGRPSGTEDQATTSPLPAAPQPPKKDDTTPVTAPAATSPGKATCPGSNGPSPGVSISCATTSDEALGMTPEVTKLLEQEEQEKVATSPNPSSDTGSETTVDSTESETTATGPEPPPQKSDISVHDNTEEKGASVSTTQENTPVDDTGKHGSTHPASTSTEEPSGQSAHPAGGATGSTANDTEGLGSVQNSSNLWAIGPVPSGDNQADGNGGGQNALKDYGGDNLKCTQNPSDKRCDLKLKIPFKPNKNLSDGHFGPGPTPDIKTIKPSESGETGGPFFPDLTADVFTATTPILLFVAAVTVALLGYSLWKYFAYLGTKRRRTYRTVRDVPSPPLDEEILEHLQRGEPPPDYGYKMVTQPASTSARRRRHPRVNHRTIIELHLEVLHECEATEWENVKEDYWQIVLQEFAQDLMRDQETNNNIVGVSTTKQGLSGHNVSSTVDPSTDTEGTHASPPNKEHPDPWSCMQTMQFATGPCPPHDPDPWSCMQTIRLETDPCPHNEDDPDPWSCMESIQLDHEQTRTSAHGDETAACTQWINWIDRNKYLLRACTTQPWFLQLKSQWKQYLREHMATNEDNVVYGHSEFGEAATLPMKKLDLWKEWVAQQHALMHIYGAEEWFKHLLNSVQEQTVPATGDVPGVETHVEVEKTQLMREVNIIFPEVTRSINQHSGQNAGICGIIYDGTHTNVATCKSRCMEIVNIMLYIRGYTYNAKNGTWNKRAVRERTRTMFHEYLRCTLATEVLVQVYGQTSDHQEVIKKVKAELEKTDTPGQKQYEPGVCEGRDYGDVIFGSTRIGTGLQKRIHEWSAGLPRGNTGTTHGTGQTCAWAAKDGEESDHTCNEEAGATPTNSELMRRILYWTQDLLYPRVKQLLQEMTDGRVPGGKCEIEKKINQKIEDTVQQVKKTADKRDEGTVQVTASGSKDTAGAKSAPHHHHNRSSRLQLPNQ